MKHIAHLEETLKPLCGKTLQIDFDGISFQSVLNSYEQQKLTGMTNSPEKRLKDGKYYTPVCVRLNFEAGSLVLAVEDFTLVGIANGIAFMFADYQVRLRVCD
jgi:hypothetical protein